MRANLFAYRGGRLITMARGEIRARTPVEALGCRATAGNPGWITGDYADLTSRRSNWVGCPGDLYPWETNWKVSARAGMQSFGGAQLLNLTPLDPFTQPILRLDLDKMDDSDNRLFGVTAQIAWTPKPAYQLTVRTPLYLTKN